MQVLLVVLLLLSGLGQPIQVAANKELKGAAGSPVFAALLSYGVGTLVLGALTLTGLFGRNTPECLRQAPWWAWVGGLLGAFAVTIALSLAGKLNLAAITAASIAGQLVASLAVDHFGWLNNETVPANKVRIAGAVLLFVAALMMQKK